MSITMRLILTVSVVMALFWGAASYLTRAVFVDEIDELTTDSMATTANHLMPLVLQFFAGKAESNETTVELDVTELPEFGDAAGPMADAAGGFLAFEVRDVQGRVKLRSGDAADLSLPLAPKPGFVKWHDVLAYTVVDHDSGLALTVMEPDRHRIEAIGEATRALIWPLVYLVPLMALAVLVLLRVSLAPVLGLSRQIAERGGTNLDPLETAGQPAELRPIGVAVDRLMDRLRSALDAERVFAANAAHELRTPIAGALAQVQRLKAELTGAVKLPDLAARADEVEGRLKHLIDFTEKLLQLSRAEAGLGLQGERQNMTALLDAILRDFGERITEPVTVVVENQLGQDLMVAMDADAFAICIRNLVENAALHGAKGRPITLIVGQDWTIRVINEGDVVAADRLAVLKDRFVRGNLQPNGSGLGLAIVDRIMRQSDGALELTSPATGQTAGFEAKLILP